EMSNQHAAIVEMDENVFGAAAEARDAPTFDAGAQADRQRLAQIGAVERQAGDAMPGHAHRQAALHGLDFRQFGHRRVALQGWAALCCSTWRAARQAARRISAIAGSTPRRSRIWCGRSSTASSTATI